MIITNKNDLKNYLRAGELSTKILAKLKQAVRPGVLPITIDNLAKDLCHQHRVKPAFVGVNSQNPYHWATCISVGDVVVHGIPSKTEAMKNGDVVKVDFGLVYQGLFTDHCFTVVIGQPSREVNKLVTTARDAVQAAITLAVEGRTTGDLGHKMQAIVRRHGFDVLKQYTGHGIGRTLHDPPAIPAYGEPKTGSQLEKNMVLCLEAQVVAGSAQVNVAADGWSVRTLDGGLSAMFEYMVVVGKSRPLVLTETLDWDMIV